MHRPKIEKFRAYRQIQKSNGWEIRFWRLPFHSNGKRILPLSRVLPVKMAFGCRCPGISIKSKMSSPDWDHGTRSRSSIMESEFAPHDRRMALATWKFRAIFFPQWTNFWPDEGHLPFDFRTGRVDTCASSNIQIPIFLPNSLSFRRKAGAHAENLAVKIHHFQTQNRGKCAAWQVSS